MHFLLNLRRLLALSGAALSPFLLILALLCACQRVPDSLEPTLSYTVQDRYIQSLPSPFPPLSAELLSQDVGKEMRIGLGFARELDLYQAITAFKRAEFLCPPEDQPLLMQIQYEVLLCYYTGKKWEDVISTFEMGSLRQADPTFPAYHDLLFILYDTYKEVGRESQAGHIFDLIQSSYPEEALRLRLSLALTRADFPALESATSLYPPIETLLGSYKQGKKGVSTAQGLNALLPGAGYLYLGQTQAAITAFCLNGLFITASVFCFDAGNVAAGIILTGFEAGWYFGGIYGAGLEAKTYNERLYESLATPLMNRDRLFPGLMLNYAF